MFVFTNRSNRSLSKLTGTLGGAFVGATMLLSPMAAYAQDGVVTNDAPIQPVSVENPYISACDSVIEAEHNKACMDAANGTVVILRNPNEVIDPVRDGFLSAVHEVYGNSIPVEFRDTDGPTTMFMFDKSAPINTRVLANGSLLHVIGVRYPQKIAAISPQPISGLLSTAE